MAIAVIRFFGKPGCRTNRRQQARLQAAGLDLEVVDILDYPWRGEELALFFDGIPVAQWFNPAAPQVKDGSIDPAACDRSAALAWLVAEPLLIRRPLLEMAGRRMAGFDLERLKQCLQIDLLPLAPSTGGPIEGCSRGDAHRSCP